MALAIVVLATLGFGRLPWALRSVITFALAPSALGDHRHDCRWLVQLRCVGRFPLDGRKAGRCIDTCGAADVSWPPASSRYRILGWFAWYPKVVFIWVLSLVVTRTAFLKFAALEVFRRRVVVVGNGKLAARIQRRGEQAADCHFTVVAFVDACIDPPKVERTDFVLGNMIDRETFASFVRRHRAHEVVVATNNRRSFFVQRYSAAKWTVSA